ncbi:hypothetical protein F5888DRAFT_1922203 [Russula emetica]|nr:hypothetical protein F5888DRAFT_1922203 [Russula emetica]
MHPAFVLSVLFFLPLASALSSLQVTSQNPSSGGSVTITWSQDSTDPTTFSLELANNNFHNTFALANNVQTSSGQLTVTLPIVPADTYTLEAVQINNVNSVIGSSGAFSVGATVTSTSSGSSTSSGLSTSGSVSSASPTGSTSTATGSFVSSSSSGSSSPSASGSSFNGNSNGALGTHINSGSVGSIAAAVVGIVAGVVFV